jgi:hypothetical protein
MPRAPKRWRMPTCAGPRSIADWRWRPPSAGSTGTIRTLKDPYDRTLAALLAEPSFQARIGRTLAVKARFIKDTGNAAARHAGGAREATVRCAH